MNATAAQIEYITDLQRARAAKHAAGTSTFITAAMAWARCLHRAEAAARIPAIVTAHKAGATLRQTADAIIEHLSTQLAADLATDPTTITKAEASAIIDRLTGKAI